MDDEEISYLRYYVAHLVRIWTALSIIRNDRSGEFGQVIQDVCSDKLRTMLFELSKKESWTIGFQLTGNGDRHDRFFKRLQKANSWFAGGKGPKSLHARNFSGAHLQPLSRASHIFQAFGYQDDREWRWLTYGVSACVRMMKLADDSPNHEFWRKIRMRVRGLVKEPIEIALNGNKIQIEMPIEVEALLQGYKRKVT